MQLLWDVGGSWFIKLVCLHVCAGAFLWLSYWTPVSWFVFLTEMLTYPSFPPLCTCTYMCILVGINNYELLMMHLYTEHCAVSVCWASEHELWFTHCWNFTHDKDRECKHTEPRPSWSFRHREEFSSLYTEVWMTGGGEEEEEGQLICLWMDGLHTHTRSDIL